MQTTWTIASCIGIGVATAISQKIPWAFAFLLLQFVGIRLYYIRNREECIRIQKNVSICSHTTDSERGCGYSIGYWYLAFIQNGIDTCVWLIATPSSYKRLSAESEIQSMHQEAINTNSSASVTTPMKSFRVMERFGSNSSIYYRSRTLLLSMEPQKEQQEIITNITTKLAKKKSVIVLLHGPPGTGKSMVSFILAKQLQGIYCNNLAPWTAGESLSNIYSYAEPSETKPLILAFDEIDGPLQDITRGIPSHKNCKIQVQDKPGWNRMMDEIQMGFYPHLVLIMTTNKSLLFFNTLDPSYMRNHRVDMCVFMSTTF
jgi:hypothetical protein